MEPSRARPQTEEARDPSLVVGAGRRPRFKLDLRETRNYPKVADLQRGLSCIQPGVNSFMILERQDGHFMQARQQYDRAWILEWQRGGRDEHFRCSGVNLTRESVARAFAGFLDGNESDVELLGWDRITLS